jgi:hypothetical protein
VKLPESKLQGKSPVITAHGKDNIKKVMASAYNTYTPDVRRKKNERFVPVRPEAMRQTAYE